jgi:phosphoglycolate phosphatase-like HAD superfamily hydrolase
MTGTEPAPEFLPSWRDGAARRAVVDFVDRVRGADGSRPVPVAERVAVFDNDGTLWCEKPAPIQLYFILRRLAAMAGADPGLRDRQPWKAAYEGDPGWFGAVLAAHYAGDDSDVPALAAGVLGAYAGVSVEEFDAEAHGFLTTGRHPTLDRAFTACAYTPMVELLEYLRANDFTNYIASGGGRDFMRPISEPVYGIPRERVIGSAGMFSYVDDERGGTVTHLPEPDYLNDGPEKPVRIWSRIGRRPLVCGGNSNGDIPMLRFTRLPDRPTLRLLLLHDDDEREFRYTAGAEDALTMAAQEGWTVISMRDDWTRVF